jgi:hypothetical protein
MAHIVRGTMRQAARLAAIADPQYPIEAEASDDSLRSRTDDIMDYWVEHGFDAEEGTP